ncbi:7TM diverse intracellular signaling domain-containing protein [Paenibacillus hexagrammi]|uniref:7TM-DISM receptor extracellular domain-containing protein n=1 Tax=Paenibacillus hexagrammi TaxID=2908839 RepID=A0ABY3ST63_9BACL|nr:7TM diverse intracellular signaling domain-containing protein [Paenibacillus sp. YPD9-1]UJF36351.1 hypothetical protein L0M14_13800 [Paenibacillus sp. YPD9-1]
MKFAAWFMMLFILLLFGCSAPYSVEATVLEKNSETDTLNLQKWQPQEGAVVSLDGPWRFYWNQLLQPQDFLDIPPNPPAIVTIPAQWKDYIIDGHALLNEGYGTYRMTFLLSDDAAERPLGLYFNNVASAYRFWVNGELMHGNGTVGMNAYAMVPRSYPRVFFFQPRAGVNEIVIQASNFSQRTGGIWESIEIGDAEKIASLHRNRVMVWTFITGCLLLMTIFSFFLYLFRKQERAALWFGLICLAICIRTSLLGESFVYVLFPGLTWEWG